MTKIWRLIIQCFVGLLPWSVLISVFFGEKLGFWIARYWKEIFLIILSGVYFLSWYRSKLKFSWDILDVLILLYGVWLIVISLANNTPLIWYIYGLRYDAMFLFSFLLLRRALPLWDVPVASLIRTFLVSGWLMLVLSLLIRYVFGEMFLTIFGFSDTIGTAESLTVPPIYHDILDSTIIRFQWVLEWPNQMAFFLIVYAALYATLFLKIKKSRFINILILLFLGFLIFETYSRSAYLWISIAFAWVMLGWVISFLSSWNVWKKVMNLGKKFIVPLIIVAALGVWLAFQFRADFYDVFTRHGSTTGHFERMEIGFTRFRMHPWWQGLAQAGPASRAIAEVNGRSIEFENIPELPLRSLAQKLKSQNLDFYFTTSTYYISESWYVQQLIEWGWIACVLLLSIFGVILMRLFSYMYLFGAMIAVMVINIFLHSFESVHSSLALFIFLAAFLPVKHIQYNWENIMKYVLWGFIFLLPWHALFMTFFQCKIHLDTTFLRFWKEAVVFLFLFSTTVFALWHTQKKQFSFSEHPLLISVVFFVISSCAYMFLPDGLSSRDLLGFRYDVFFLFMLLGGLYFTPIRQYSWLFLNILFASTALIVVIFFAWYLFFDIGLMTEVFGYSSLVSTFHPEWCLAFAQNVSGHHRFQATFGGPIRLSVFLVWVYMLFLWKAMMIQSNLKKIILTLSVSGVIFAAIAYSYSKTAYIGLIVSLVIFVSYMIRFHWHIFSKKIVVSAIILLFLWLGIVLYNTRDLLLHLGSILERQQNLLQTWHMFVSQPLWYGLGTAGPASQIQAGSALTNFSASGKDFLPESWYLQILIEQGIIGLGIFLLLLFFIWKALWEKLQKEKDPYSIAIFSAFAGLLVMGLFTHVFEEAATSYIFFLFVGLHLAKKLWK